MGMDRKEIQRRYREKNRGVLRKRAREYQRNRWDKDPEAGRLRLREYRRRVREEVLTAYGGKCTCCGEMIMEFLALDHINGVTQDQRATERKSGISWYLRLRREGYPNHIRVLCHNCNMARGFYGYCPHVTGGVIPVSLLSVDVKNQSHKGI